MSTIPISELSPPTTLQTLPNATESPEAIVGYANTILEELNQGRIENVVEEVKKIFSSGQILAARAFFDSKHADFLLKIIEKLLDAINDSSLDHKPHTRYFLARALRLFCELEMLRSLEEDGTGRKDRILQFTEKLSVLIRHAEDQACSGLKFELKCIESACKRWIHKDHIWQRYGPRFIKLVLTLGLSEFADGIDEALSLIRDLRKEQSGSWYDKVFYMSFLGSLATRDIVFFTKVHEMVGEAYKSRTTYEDKKMLLAAGDFLADLVWRGDPQIKSWALFGREGAPGLIQLGQIGTNQGKSRKIKDTGTNLFKKVASLVDHDTLGLKDVRYHICCLLSALKECDAFLPDESSVSNKVSHFLSTRNNGLETKDPVKSLLNTLVKEPKREYRSFFQLPRVDEIPVEVPPKSSTEGGLAPQASPRKISSEHKNWPLPKLDFLQVCLA